MVSCIQIVVLHTIILVSKQHKNFQHKTKQLQTTMVKTLDHIGQTKLMLQFLICIDNVFIITSMIDLHLFTLSYCQWFSFCWSCQHKKNLTHTLVHCLYDVQHHSYYQLLMGCLYQSILHHMD